MSKDKNHGEIARKLDSLEYSNVWSEEYTDNEKVMSILSAASKTGEGNIGKPDHIYVNEHKKLLILVEDKPVIGEHTADSFKEKYIDDCILKAITNSQLSNKKAKISVFDNNIKYHPTKYAVDGITWYLSFFKQKNIQKDSLKNYFLDWKILGIAVSGDIHDKYNHRVSTFVLVHDEIKEKSVNTLENEDDYINLCKNIVEEDLIQNISASSKRINRKLRQVDSQKRPILLSALMICLFEYDNDEIDNSFITQYSAWKPQTIAENIPIRVNNILIAEGILEEKRKVIKAQLEFVKYDKELTTTKVLCEILDELRKNVISKFNIASNYDIIGKFYEEFLRYAGVANVKKGIVLTPYHITTLFTELIPIEADDVFLDGCCGTGAFLIAGMNRLLQIYEQVEDRKTKTLLEQMEGMKECNLVKVLDTIRDINNCFSKEDSQYKKLLFSESEKNELAEGIAGLHEKSIHAYKQVIYKVREKYAKQIFDAVKTNQLIGFEVNPTMYSLAISNMIFRGDGKSRIYYENYFDQQVDEQLKKLSEKGIKPTIGFINPPYGGKDNKDNPTKMEIQFLERLLTHVSKYAVIIAPLSTFFNNHDKRNIILEHNTLKYVINMPKDLFQPNASINTAIAVFEVGKPQANQEVIFYDLKEDGFVLSKSKGRTNAYGKWDKIKSEMLERLFHSENYCDELEQKTVFLKTQISKNAEWVIQEYAKTDYSQLSSENFINAIKNYAVYKVKKELDLIVENINELSMAEILADYYDVNFGEMKYTVESVDM